MNIMYIHGLLGSADGSTTQLLRQSFPQDNILSVEYDNYDCKKGLQDILDFYHAFPEIDVIVGCSLGGFYAQMLCNRPKILINPAFNGGADVKKYVSESLDKVSPTFATDLDAILNEFLRDEYDYEYYCETTTVFCLNDDVIKVDNDRLALYNKMYHPREVILTGIGKHRITSEIIPTLASLLDEVRKTCYLKAT